MAFQLYADPELRHKLEVLRLKEGRNTVEQMRWLVDERLAELGIDPEEYESKWTDAEK